MNRLKTNFLAADASFLTGAGTVFNLAGSSYHFDASSSNAEADAKALFMDWAITGQDLRDAMHTFESEEQLKFSFAD